MIPYLLFYFQILNFGNSEEPADKRLKDESSTITSERNVTLSSLQPVLSPPGPEVLTQFSCNELITLDFNVPSATLERPTENVTASAEIHPQNAYGSSPQNFNIMYNLNEYSNTPTNEQSEPDQQGTNDLHPVNDPTTIAPGDYVVQADFQTFNYVYSFVLDSGYYPPDPHIIQNMVNDYARGENLLLILNRYKQWLTRR